MDEEQSPDVLDEVAPMRISVILTALPAAAAFGTTWAQVDNWRFTQLVPLCRLGE